MLSTMAKIQIGWWWASRACAGVLVLGGAVFLGMVWEIVWKVLWEPWQ